jgi:hypothetical protein
LKEGTVRLTDRVHRVDLCRQVARLIGELVGRLFGARAHGGGAGGAAEGFVGTDVLGGARRGGVSLGAARQIEADANELLMMLHLLDPRAYNRVQPANLLYRLYRDASAAAGDDAEANTVGEAETGAAAGGDRHRRAILAPPGFGALLADPAALADPRALDTARRARRAHERGGGCGGGGGGRVS